MTDQRTTTAMEVINTALERGNCRSLIDIGCGSGGLKSAIEALGVCWTGVDPAPNEGAGITQAGAEALPFDDNAFDAVLFLNSLHHIPIDLMPRALKEALRVLAPGAGPVIVIEPKTDGDLSEVLRRFDDETVVRTAAQGALADVVDGGHASLLDAFEYVRSERYENFQNFADRLCTADASRAEAFRINGKEISDAFHRTASLDNRGYVLRQPMRACCLGHP